MKWFLSWTPDDIPAKIVDTRAGMGFDLLRNIYTPDEPVSAFERVLEIAQAHGVQSVVVEQRYIDVDYRSDFSNFHSTTFRRYPSITHRLHFFKTMVPNNLQHLDSLQDQYVGYSVMRPLKTAPVGRTMLAPPPVSSSFWCTASEEINLLGSRLIANAVPFISQDMQYFCCAHSDEWMVLFHAHLFHEMARRLPADIHDAALGGDVVDRQVPSMGLSLGQMLNSLHKMGLSTYKLALPESRADSQAETTLSLPAILCRYVDSQMPPIVVSEDHCWTIAGYQVSGGSWDHDNIVFFKHDDAEGPYLPVVDPWKDVNSHGEIRSWDLVLPPVPRKCYLTAERAELLSLELLIRTINDGTTCPSTVDVSMVEYQTYGISSVRYKLGLAVRGLPPGIAQVYLEADWPKYIWVTEAHQSDLRNAGRPSVLGEVILDSTAHQYVSIEDPEPVLGMQVCGTGSTQSPDFSRNNIVRRAPWIPYASGSPALALG
jgi:hypothetical protein